MLPVIGENIHLIYNKKPDSDDVYIKALINAVYFASNVVKGYDQTPIQIEGSGGLKTALTWGVDRSEPLNTGLNIKLALYTNLATENYFRNIGLHEEAIKLKKLIVDALVGDNGFSIIETLGGDADSETNITSTIKEQEKQVYSLRERQLEAIGYTLYEYSYKVDNSGNYALKGISDDKMKDLISVLEQLNSTDTNVINNVAFAEYSALLCGVEDTDVSQVSSRLLQDISQFDGLSNIIRKTGLMDAAGDDIDSDNRYGYQVKSLFSFLANLSNISCDRATLERVNWINDAFDIAAYNINPVIAVLGNQEFYKIFVKRNITTGGMKNILRLMSNVLRLYNENWDSYKESASEEDFNRMNEKVSVILASVPENRGSFGDWASILNEIIDEFMRNAWGDFASSKFIDKRDALISKIKGIKADPSITLENAKQKLLN